VSSRERVSHLGDFTLRPGVLRLCALAVPLGALGAVCALALLRLIGLITNLVFYGRIHTSLVAPGGGHPSPLLVLLAPPLGGLAVGLMARFGSEQIRGHGMPEALEAILTRGSRVQPRVALLKPISAAISIGSGGPFGAEGPIIMTGGAVGSLLAQLLHTSADERKTLLVAGAAGGMAATFNAPLASVLLAVELLLFEWRPRSFIPVVTAVATSTVLRWSLLGGGPVFGVHADAVHLGAEVQLLCVLVGLSGGLLAILATGLVYLSEDTFARLPLHWMWWPAIGGLIVGLGGLIEPRALGVGYDVIRELLEGRATISLILGVLLVKTAIWSLSLGSGTSGGVLAPMFMVGAALGALEGTVLPGVTPGFWALVGLAGVLGGVMRSPLTGVVFPLELTHAWPLLLPLLLAATGAYALSTLTLRRSVLTEKIARRGLHITREYSIDPLETLLVEEVMSADYVAVDNHEPLAGLRDTAIHSRQPLYPVLDRHGRLAGVLTRGQLLRAEQAHSQELAGQAALPDPLTIDPRETLREAAQRFAAAALSCAPVVEQGPAGRPLGLLTVENLLHARLIDVHEEHARERVLRVRPPDSGPRPSPPPRRPPVTRPPRERVTSGSAGAL
jgi:H+/Cl- antiporter ClcA